MIIHNIDQNTPEWKDLRCGKFTASDAQAISAQGKGLETLVYKKVAEILTGKQKESYTNASMERGHELEEMAVNAYEIETGNITEKIGFYEMNEFVGASPDRKVMDEKGLVEIKCLEDLAFVEYLVSKKIDTGYMWQMQMQLLVSDFEWVDYVVFNPDFEKNLIIVRVYRNEADVAKIQAGLNLGIAMIKSLLEKINGK